MQIDRVRKILWLSLLFLVVWGALGIRLYQLQLVQGPDYAKMAFQQRALSLPVGSQRGLILDRRGEPLTDPQERWGVAVFPPLIPDVPAVIRALAPVVGMAEEELRRAMAAVEATSAEKQRPVWVATDISAETAVQIGSLRLPGVAAGPVGERYGSDALARHLIGYVNDQGGQLGLEKVFNQELVGEAVPSMVAYLDGRGAPLAGLGIRTAVPTAGKPPYQVETTIDRRMQQVVEQVLDQHDGPNGEPLRGAVVVLDPLTGEVLAMASRPQFEYQDLSTLLARQDGGSYLVNRAVSPYPPGSVFKPVVAAMALERGQVALDESFTCTGHYDVGGHRFSDADGQSHGEITFRDAVARSCNVTFLRLGHERLGTSGLREAAQVFGFGRPTGVLGQQHSWPEEATGRVPSASDPGALQIAFGQGSLEASPLQVARAYAAFANGGTLPGVKLVRTIKSPAGEVVLRPTAEQPKRIMSRKTAAEVRESLMAVTDPAGEGTGRKAWVAAGGSAGKTGSAQGKDAQGRDTVHAWFAGYLPVRSPRYVITVLVEGGGTGGSAAAPVFQAIGDAILQIR